MTLRPARRAGVPRGQPAAWPTVLAPLLRPERPDLGARLPSDGDAGAAARARGGGDRSASSCMCRSRRPTCSAPVPEPGLLLRDLLAADLLGFQTDNDVEQFRRRGAAASPAPRASRGQWLGLGGRRVRLGVFPVEIDAREFEPMRPSTRCARRRCRSCAAACDGAAADAGRGPAGPDQGAAAAPRRLPPRCWRSGRSGGAQVTLLQIAADVAQGGRQPIASCARSWTARPAAINSDFGEPDWRRCAAWSRAGARSTVAGYMRLARVGLVTPLRDGMNLVAKEYIAAQDPQDPGVLVLSRFAGAAQQLGGAAGQPVRRRRDGRRDRPRAAHGPRRAPGALAGMLARDRAPHAAGMGPLVPRRAAAGEQRAGLALGAHGHGDRGEPGAADRASRSRWSASAPFLPSHRAGRRTSAR